ncbi:MAG: hypothetical protein M3162_08665 [Thermoproteota archaeon]|nr:hypothetical protein [Thermoproteota archaeon]
MNKPTVSSLFPYLRFICSKITGWKKNTSLNTFVDNIIHLSKIRVEILIPKQYNNNEFIEDKKFLDTYSELVDQFGKISKISDIAGNWVEPKTNIFYEDENHIIWIICDDSQENKIFFSKYKEILKERFQQKEILMYYYLIYPI